MKNFLKITTLMAAVLTPSLGFSQENSSIDVSAKVEPGCFLDAEDINFGVLQMPLIDSAAQSNIKIKCSKDTNLMFHIEYGAGDSNYTYQVARNNILSPSLGGGLPFESIKIMNNGIQLSSISWDMECWAAYPGKVYFNTYEAAELFGYTGQIQMYIDDNQGLCTNSGSFVDSSLNSLNSGSGILSGLVSNEKIAYAIQSPTDSSKIWNRTNKYSLVSDGQEQVVQMKAKINKSENPTHRMTPDTYQSTVTVVLNY